MWLHLFVYLIVWTITLIGVLEAYAWLLRLVARLPRPLPLVLGLLLYVTVACICALVFYVPEFVLGPRESSELAREMWMGGYLVSAFLAILVFRHRHLDALKKLGYYQPRTPR